MKKNLILLLLINFITKIYASEENINTNLSVNKLAELPRRTYSQISSDNSLRSDQLYALDIENLSPQQICLLAEKSEQDLLAADCNLRGLMRDFESLKTIQRYKILARLQKPDLPEDILDNPTVFWVIESDRRFFNYARSSPYIFADQELMASKRSFEAQYHSSAEVVRKLNDVLFKCETELYQQNKIYKPLETNSPIETVLDYLQHQPAVQKRNSADIFKNKENFKNNCSILVNIVKILEILDLKFLLQTPGTTEIIWSRLFLNFYKNFRANSILGSSISTQDQFLTHCKRLMNHFNFEEKSAMIAEDEDQLQLIESYLKELRDYIKRVDCLMKNLPPENLSIESLQDIREFYRQRNTPQMKELRFINRAVSKLIFDVL